MSASSGPVVYIDTSRIRQGKLDQVKAAVRDLVEYVAKREPQLISYRFYIEEESGQMTVVAIHPDSNSILIHMDIAGPSFRQFEDLIDLIGIDVYGRVSAQVEDRLRQKAEMLGKGKVSVHSAFDGLDRLEASR